MPGKVTSWFYGFLDQETDEWKCRGQVSEPQMGDTLRFQIYWAYSNDFPVFSPFDITPTPRKCPDPDEQNPSYWTAPPLKVATKHHRVGNNNPPTDKGSKGHIGHNMIFLRDRGKNVRNERRSGEATPAETMAVLQRKLVR
jgi:hypothetical protein